MYCYFRILAFQWTGLKRSLPVTISCTRVQTPANYTLEQLNFRQISSSVTVKTQNVKYLTLKLKFAFICSLNYEMLLSCYFKQDHMLASISLYMFCYFCSQTNHLQNVVFLK